MSHKFVILDEIMNQLEAAQSGVVPGSITQAVVSGVQNVPSNITQSRIGGNSSTSYTTLPLSPIVKNCCLDKTYINMEFDCNFGLKTTLNTAAGSSGVAGETIPFYVGFRDGAQIFNQVQILIENSAIWQTVYNREEALICYNALPETEIRGNPQYASIDKLRENLNCPMKKVIITTATIPDTKKEGTVNVSIRFKITVDINRLTPLLSNLHFTTPHMGNLRLKLFLQEIEKAMFICPDYSVIKDSTAKRGDWVMYPFNKLFVDGENLLTAMNIINVAGQAITSTNDKLTILQIVQPTSGDFITFKDDGIIEIVQTCFDIKTAEYDKLTDYFANMGSIIIPSQTLSSNVFNNSVISGPAYPTSQIGSVGGYNIDFISVWNHPPSCPSIGVKPFTEGIQLLLDGQVINQIPYRSVDDKCVVDSTQALIDTDTEEINKDYIRSLNYLNDPSGKHSYVHDLATFCPAGSKITGWDNPYSFVLNFSTNLPNAFHSGACILENSNRQATIRYLNNSQNRNIMELSTKPLYDSKAYPYNLNPINTELVSGFTCFCDCCIVLNYDAARGTCYDGSLSWAAPYI